MGAAVALGDVPAPSSPKDRRLAAMAYLVGTFCGLPVLLALLIANDTRPPFCRLHVRRAPGAQLRMWCFFLAVAGVTAAFPENQYWWLAMVIAWATTLVLEIPNIRRALAGRPPQRLRPPQGPGRSARPAGGAT